MRVEIHLYTQSHPVTIEGALNAYTKGPMYCVLTDGAVYKFPIRHIFRVKEIG